MRRGSPNHFRAAWLLFCALASAGVTLSAMAQSGGNSQIADLLRKAHSAEVRGRMDMAKETWQQVLLSDPNNAEALAGMARAAKSAGNQAEADEYLRRLRTVSPNDPSIGKVESMQSTQAKSRQLQEAGRLARSGQYDRAMDIQRQVFGNLPPEGDLAIGYYETEASTPQGRVPAAAGLRALAAKYPQDTRYQISLGKVLTYNPRTREEGRRILERFPYDPGAQQAIHDSLTWDVQNPAATREIRAYLAQHPDPQLESDLQQAEAGRFRGRGGAPLSADQGAANAAFAARSSEERAAYAALNAHKYAEADALFRRILEKHPHSCQALAGMGYVRMSQTNFAGAISFLEQAEQDGCKDAAFERALHDSRFFYTVQVATTALNDNDLFTAEKEFELALKLRPNDSSALLGLGGTLLKAQQAEQAIPVFVEYIKHAPGDMRAWRGLLMAQFGAGKYNDALETDRRIPPPVKAELVKDPDYLRTLASVYLAEGREGEAQRIFQLALNLPFKDNGKGLKVDVQLQYAALLATAGRREQAAGLYKQVLQTEPTNMNAWVGLVQVEHQLGHDAEAYQLVQQMPPQIFAGAMQEAGFETSLAAIYEGSGHDELAQDVLEKFLAKQKAEGKKPFVSAEVQLAAIYVRRGNPAQAYALYRAVLEAEPNRADAWVGVLSSLHSTEHDPEALAQLQQIPPAIRAELDKDPSYLEIVGSIYSSSGDTREAELYFNRVQQHYAAEHVMPPADVQIQQAWMLYNAGADGTLYQQLMLLGGRQDLTDRQRLTVQTIWTNWAVRRANQNVAAGNYRRAIMILNATAKSFPGNPEVIKALATGYAAAGMTKEAIGIFRAENMSNAPAPDYRAAVGAALAGNDLRDAEMWLRFGLERYPRDPQLLILAAKFETSRGDANRAADYYKASLRAMPVVDPGAQLAAELSHPAPAVPATLPSSAQPQDLATLLAQPDRAQRDQAQVVPHPYLPSYNQPAMDVPVPMGGSAPGYGAPYGSGWASPQPGTYPPATFPAQSVPDGQPAMPANPPQHTHPQSEWQARPLHAAKPQQDAVLRLHASPQMEAKYGPYVSYDPSAGVPHFTSAPRGLGDGVLVTAGANAQPVTARMRQTTYQQQSSSDGVPTVQYIPQSQAPPSQVPQPASPPSKPITQRQTPRARAAAIHLNQAQGQAGLTGQSHPPAETIQPTGATLSNAQFSSQPYDPAQMQGSQVPQPQASPRSNVPAQPTYAQPQSSVTPDTSGQQYPQPGAGPTTGTAPTRPRRRPAAKPVPSTPVPTSGPSYGPIPSNYPAPPAQPLTDVGAPQVLGQYTLGQPPSDYDLQQQNLPPLRGYYDPRGEDRQPLTQRQQAELALEGIEGSYSGWAGLTAIGHHRSGTPGVDRLSSLEIPVEVSLVAGRTVRISIIPKAVFLSNGQLDTQGGSLGTTPILGSLNGTALFNPPQQFASGVGGEVQLATHTFSVAVGTTPYEFLVTNIIGRGQWRPGNSHVTLFGGRDPVKETELSYAGLRDPASASLNYSGNVWGGVLNTGGGARLDFGGEKSGLYLVGEGGYLTGFHVLDNRKFDGTMGAYFRVASWPEYGSLNIGGLVFGEHFEHNERANTYGLGGYFSPEAYFLAAVPVTFNGHYGAKLHYIINSSLGVQTFEEDNGSYFPLDPGLQTAAYSACVNAVNSIVPIVNRNCGQQPVNSNTGLNYALDSEISYQFSDHWYVGGFLSANNTNNYNSVTGGFFARYTFKPQVSAPDYPTGLFPVEGFRPFQVP